MLTSGSAVSPSRPPVRRRRMHRRPRQAALRQPICVNMRDRPHHVPLHLELPADDVESLRAFAIAHGLTLAEWVSRWAQSLKAANGSKLSAIHPEVIAITGLVPREWTEVETDYQRHLLAKHSIPMLVPQAPISQSFDSR